MSALDRAVATADAVLDELKGRKGFDWWWDDLDADIKGEIREAIAERIREVERRPLTVMETGSAVEIADEIDYERRSRREADPDGVY